MCVCVFIKADDEQRLAATNTCDQLTVVFFIILLSTKNGFYSHEKQTNIKTLTSKTLPIAFYQTERTRNVLLKKNRCLYL